MLSQERNSQWHMGLQFLGDIHASGVTLDIMNYVAGISACSWAKPAKHGETLKWCWHSTELRVWRYVELLKLSRIDFGWFWGCSHWATKTAPGAPGSRWQRALHFLEVRTAVRYKGASILHEPPQTIGCWLRNLCQLHFWPDILYLLFKGVINQPTTVGVDSYNWYTFSNALQIAWSLICNTVQVSLLSFVFCQWRNRHLQCSICFLPWSNRCQQQ